MRPLETNRYIFSWLCLYPSAEDASSSTLLAKRFVAAHFFVVTFLFLVGSCVFVYQHVIDDLERSLFAILQIAALTYVIYTQIFGRILKPKIRAIDQLCEFHHFYKDNEPMYEYLAEANRRSEGFTIFYCKLISSIKSVTILILFLKLIVFGFFVGMHKYKNTTYQMAIPWDDQTPSVKIGIAVYCMYTSIVYLFIASAFVTFFVAICKHCQAFSKQFQYLAWNLDPTKPQQSLHELVQHHQSAKEIFFQTSELYSVFVWFVIACSIVQMSVAIFQLDIAFSSNRKGSLSDYLMILLASTSNLFLYCYYGKQATDSFGNMTGALYDSKWLDFAPKWRKYFLVAIGNTQRPLYYNGFNIMVLNLESYTNVLKTVFSYYMMFKTLNE